MLVDLCISDVWGKKVDGLRRTALPEGHPVPAEFFSAIRLLEGQTDDRSRQILLARTRSVQETRAVAKQWNITPERVRQLESKGRRRLALALESHQWTEAPQALADPPQVVLLPEHTETIWSLLVSVASARSGGRVSTYKLDALRWVVVQTEAHTFIPGLSLPTGRFFTEEEASAFTGISADLLRVVWPAARLTRTQSGHYADFSIRWTSREWLEALSYILAGTTPFHERELFAALKRLPDAPQVQDSTLRQILRLHPDFSRGETAGVWQHVPP
ncbi:hypothetical protein [Deinococcus multiflagellatus]|uniref:RNA polymerase sigma-70 region 4 domain-containing protein n=1 Tax=Deinococcus multiflagellatus TaxID=1656887 RepID=A0ABW1ZPY6_9DEIO|nr:hypothetical protein [Deinococcus multiflagellatus]MBZ9715801.1 hypothetical protein [Deinococcus multiflagellatus]